MEFKVQTHDEEPSGEQTGDSATAAKCAQWMIDAGHFTQEQANQKLKFEDHNISVTPTVSPTSSVAVDMQKLFPAGKPLEYEIPHDPKFAKENMQQRDWLSALGLPKNIGNAVASKTKETSESFSRLNDSQKSAWLNKQTETLTSIWGDKVSEKLQLAKDLVNKVEAQQPGLKAFLDRTGAGNDAMVIAMLHDQAVRLNLKK